MIRILRKLLIKNCNLKMGITLSQQTQLDLNKLATINVMKLWNENSQSGSMSEAIFQKFLSSLSQTLSMPLTPTQVSNAFNKLQNKGEVSFSSFETEFTSWCNDKVKEDFGTEVLQPMAPQHVINKEYQLFLETNSIVYKKFYLNNPDSFDKDLTVKSENDVVMKVRTPRIIVKRNSGEHVRLKIIAPTLEGKFQCNLVLQHASSLMIEEVLRFNLEFKRKEERISFGSSGQRPPSSSGSIKKTNSWSFLGRSPSPSRNLNDS
ncbi:unnamed protein product [Blepharisma stoltei]|uniref:Uncharacterized protein n=1 Tax=Blepharisma stoltei TaxID=1481888 RepID=A0AAU9IZ99_9CILI|nr:unnamed protein product [Blepharisma stoltei]